MADTARTFGKGELITAVVIALAAGFFAGTVVMELRQPAGPRVQAEAGPAAVDGAVGGVGAVDGAAAPVSKEDEALCRQLSCDVAQLQSARAELQQSALIAYRRPLYQVLDLSPAPLALPTGVPRPSVRRDGEPVAIGTILQQLLGGTR